MRFMNENQYSDQSWRVHFILFLHFTFAFIFNFNNGKQTQPGSLAHIIHDRSYWGAYWPTNLKRDDLIDNQWNWRIGRILGMIPYTDGYFYGHIFWPMQRGWLCFITCTLVEINGGWSKRSRFKHWTALTLRFRRFRINVLYSVTYIWFVTGMWQH